MTGTLNHPEPEKTDGRVWLSEFVARSGRPLRVLHIGNIANNAYNNAKIQREIGIEADVVCHDYYHIMGCPEWEDAQFIGEIKDDFFPDWWSVDLNGFRRPHWFAQGRLATCQRYLVAYRRARPLRTMVLRRSLNFERWLLCRSTPLAHRVSRLLRRAKHVLRGARRGGRALLLFRPTVVFPPDEELTDLQRVHRSFRREVVHALQRAAHVLSTLGSGTKLDARSGSSRWLGAFDRLLSYLGHRFANLALEAEMGGVRWSISYSIRILGLKAIGALCPRHSTRDRSERSGDGEPVSRPDRQLPRDLVEDAPTPLTELFARLYPGREPLTHRDYASYEANTGSWLPLLEHYDVVQAYSTDSIIPLLAGFGPYTAYEHGTLRSIPFEDTPAGRLCSLSYHEAPAVFVTNTDVVGSARKLGIREDRMVFLPHAVDSAKLARFGEQNAGVAPPRDEIVFFSPSRHHWVDGDDKNWAKGNDRYLRAFAEVARDAPNCRLVLIDWGRDVAASKALSERLSIEDRISWLAPLKKDRLLLQYLSSHAVIDQFVTPAMGGVAFESIALGLRVLTAIDLASATDFFGEPPPLLVCSSSAEIARAMRLVIDDPHDLAGRGRAAKDWFFTYHSTDRILALELAAYAVNPAERVSNRDESATRPAPGGGSSSQHRSTGDRDHIRTPR